MAELLALAGVERLVKAEGGTVRAARSTSNPHFTNLSNSSNLRRRRWSSHSVITNPPTVAASTPSQIHTITQLVSTPHLIHLSNRLSQQTSTV